MFYGDEDEDVEEQYTEKFTNKNPESEDEATPCSCKKKKRSKSRQRSKSRLHFEFTRYPRYKEIESWIRKLPIAYPNRVEIEKIGESIQKRPIYMIILKGCENMPKISVMIEAGIHAREWLSPTTAIYFVNFLLKHPQELKFADVYVIPCLNPDGYEYTHTHDRLWRKNMNKNNSRDERHWGVDLNRNFPFAYGRDSGSSDNPARLTYRGKYSLSEPESQSLANTLKKYGKYIQFYLAIHCHGSLIMYPWGYTEELISDEQDLKKCAHCGAMAMKRNFPESNFTVGSIADRMYLSSGGSSDYARGSHKIKFSYTIELQRFGESGFEANPSKILKVAKEAYVGIKAMFKYVYRFYTATEGPRKRKASKTHLYCIECKRFKSRDCF